MRQVCEAGQGAIATAERARAPAPPSSLDFRRRGARERAERILSRAKYLPRHERWLIEAVFEDGWTIRRIAELCRAHPRVMSKRIARIVARLQSPEFAFVAVRLKSWGRTRRAVGRACILEGLSQREAARRLGVSLHVVRRHYLAIQGMVEEVK